VRSKLTAPQIARYTGKKTYFEMPKGMKVIFYAKYPKEQTRLTADYGIGYDSGNGMERMEAQRNVVVINEQGDKLNTEQLTWNAFTKKIYTNKFVKITTKDEVIWGDGLDANQDFSQYQIKNVKGQINIKN
jgi:LPS export ABC transporter protein LptC